MGKASRRKEEGRWTPLRRTQSISVPLGRTGRRVDMTIGQLGIDELWANERYTVEVRYITAPAPFGRGKWISFHDAARTATHDWREIQRIKNEVLGPEVEAVEIYPAESRLVDESNQFHLWAFEGVQPFPFGYAVRSVETPESLALSAPQAKQRPFSKLTPAPADAGASEASSTRPQRGGRMATLHTAGVKEDPR